MPLSSLPLAICRKRSFSPLQKGLLQLAWKITAHFLPKQSWWVPDRKCSKPYVLSRENASLSSLVGCNSESMDRGWGTPLCREHSTAHCLLYSIFTSTNREAAPSSSCAQTGQVPVSLHCYSSPILSCSQLLVHYLHQIPFWTCQEMSEAERCLSSHKY